MSESGRGETLVLCHGGPGLWDYFGDVAASLVDVAHTVRWDQRGCGRSDSRGPFSVDRSVADLDAVRARAGAARIALLGHSWGAMLALRYTLEHPDRVSRLIYVSGTGIDPDETWKPTFRRNLRANLGDGRTRWEELSARERTPAEDRELAVLQWSADYADPVTALERAGHLATPWFGINHDCNATISAELSQDLKDTDLAARCAEIEAPVLIIDGARDIRPRDAVDSLHRAIPHCQRIILPEAGHLPWVEAPAAFHSAVVQFLASERIRVPLVWNGFQHP